MDELSKKIYISNGMVIIPSTAGADTIRVKLIRNYITERILRTVVVSHAVKMYIWIRRLKTDSAR